MKTIKQHAILALGTLLAAASAGQGEEPGNIDRNGVTVFKAVAPQYSDYYLPGTENLYPPLLHADNFYGGSLQLKVPGTWDAGNLYGFMDGAVLVYDDFLNNMGYTAGGDGLAWPVDGAGAPLSYLNATSFTGLFGSYLSRAYRTTYEWTYDDGLAPTTGFHGHGFPRVGSPVGVRVLPNYPPTTHRLESSTSPLVPATIAGTTRAIYSTRETVGGQLDLITGQPLLREVDLEVPFGGAVFRRIRTYSEPSATGLVSHNWDDDGSWHRTRTPGWHGSGWMSSDAPLFLIDASIAQTHTTPTDTSPRCIFVLDAHHSVPFIQQVSAAIGQPANTTNGYVVDYIAPEWFDAILLHSEDGEWDAARSTWAVPPTEFRVILNKRSVTYVIKPYYEDVDPQEHRVPGVQTAGSGQDQFSGALGSGNGEAGIPYYGLVSEIRDRAGNRVVYNYATEHQPFDGPIYELFQYPNSPDEFLQERHLTIRQRGWYKGMIDNIQLFAAGETEPAWTLLYTYRAFAAERAAYSTHSFWDDKSFPPALHSILAYKGDIVTEHPSTVTRDLILKNHEPVSATCLPEVPGPGWTVDTSSLDIEPGGHSSVDIDAEPVDSTQPGSSGFNSPPFATLWFDDPNNPCDSQVLPIPLATGHPNQFDYQDVEIGPAGEGDDPTTWSKLSGDWVKQVRFSYAPPPQYDQDAAYTLADDYTWKAAGPVGFPARFGNSSQTYSVPQMGQMAYLLKVRSIQRDDQIAGASASGPLGQERYWMYRYQDTEGAGDGRTPVRYTHWSHWDEWQSGSGTTGSTGDEMPRRLSHRYTPRAIDAIATESIWSSTEDGHQPALSKNEYINRLIGMDEYETVPTISGEDLPLYRMADTSFLRWSEPYHFPGVRESGSAGAVTFGSAGDSDKIAYAGSWAAFDGELPNADASVPSVPSAFQTDLRDNFLGSVKSDACPDLQISQADEPRTGFLPEGTSIFVSTDEGGNRRWYRMYRFITTPSGEPTDDEEEPSWRGVNSQNTTVGGHDPQSDFFRGPELVLSDDFAPAVTHALYQYPYRFAIADDEFYGFPDPIGYGQHSRSEPMWWVVFDEYASLDAALSVNSSLTHADSSGDGWSSDFFTGQDDWSTRRVVALNSAGLVLSDRTWDDAQEPDSPPAILEAYVYDDYMRTSMKMSRGWGSELSNREADTQTPSTFDEGENGLVEVFTYHDPVEVTLPGPDGVSGNADDIVDLEVPREVTGVWLNKGCTTPANEAGELQVSQLVYYGDIYTDAPDYIADQMHSQQVFDLLGNAGLGTIHHRVEYWQESDIPSGEDIEFDPENPPVKWELHAGAVFKRAPTGPDLRPVDITFYNVKGQLVWRVSGSMAGIFATPPESYTGAMNGNVDFSVNAADELFLNYRQYDEEGREFIAIEDIHISENYTPNGDSGFTINDLQFPPSGSQQAWPIDETEPHGTLFLVVHDHAQLDDLSDNLAEFWAALGSDVSLLQGLYRQAEAPALDLVTYREFTEFGPSKVVHETGVRDLYEYSLQSAYLEELSAMGIEFDGESWGFAGQQLFDSDFDGQQFVEQIQSVIDDLLAGEWEGDPATLDQIFSDYRIETLAHVTPSYDSAGRMSSMQIDSDPDDDVDAIEQFVAFDGWGNILRSQDPNGAIERRTYDKFGRHHKTFKGSKDRHEVWGTADYGQENDDMFLVEKLHYGLGTNDAGEVTHKWMFRERSIDENSGSTDPQYGADFDEPSEGDFTSFPSFFQAGSSTAGQTSSGSLEEYVYDWRMRKVITKRRGLDPQQSNTGVYREERVFLDNADRVRFVALYDGEANANAPSPDIDPGNDLPHQSGFFLNGADANLLSLTETVYNGAGQTVETRRYDIDCPNPNDPGYLVTQNYTDHANKPTWSRDSAQRITKNVYDAKGRLAWSSVWAGETELRRTRNVYGPTDTVDMMVVFERIDTAGTPAGDLDSADKRVKLIHQWFDGNKRLIAVADFGEVFYNGTIENYAPPARPGAAPVILADLPADLPPAGSDPREPPKLLVGIDYLPEWIDSNGRGLARVDAYWYGPMGKKSAVLRMLNAEPDGLDHTRLEYTIDRYEYNNYGQKILEHSYGFDISSPTDPASQLSPDTIAGAAEFIGGAVFSYEVEGYDDNPADGIDPPLFASTNVREITPLTAGHVLAWNIDLRRYEVDWANSTDPVRKTVLEYNAPVVQPGFALPSEILHPTQPYMFPIHSNDWGHLGISNRPDLVKAVHMPHPTGGGTGDGTGYSFFYFYYADGLPAIRLDSRGIAIHYIYDERGNLVRLQSDDTNLPLATPLSEGGMGLVDAQLPSNFVGYEYDAIDRLVLLTTGRDYSDGTTVRIDAESLIEYDGLGNMLKEYQSRDGVVNTGTTPVVEYDWERVYAQSDYSSGQLVARDNINRIASVTYPARTGTHDGGAHSPRKIKYGYGALGLISDLLDRVEDVTSEGGPTNLALTQVADYVYSGLNRLEEINLGEPFSATPGTGEHILRDVRTFDPFGRVSNRTVSAFDGGTSYRTVMGSDFGYDIGSRRIFERLTQQDVDASTSRDNVHSVFYDHDLKGRLVGEKYGVLQTDGFNGIDEANSTQQLLEMNYALDLLNRRVGLGSAPGIELWDDANHDGIRDTAEILEQTHLIDERGAITGLSDGSNTATVDHDVAGSITGLHARDIYYDWLGRPVLVNDSWTGKPVAAYTYDGFGRLATRKALWPAADKSTVYREEVYYYDGVRRIQEVFTDPVDALPPWQVTPGDEPQNSSAGTPRTEAEYIWSAAGGQPFDTCHVQIDWWDREAWFIQDHATGTVRGYTDANGEIARQYRFDAFGNLTNLDTFPLAGSGGLFANFRNRLGHHGLFAERVDGDTTQLTLSPNPSAELWYQSRSRWYVPELGRFMTSDPNETGIPTMNSLAMLGRVPTGPPSGSFGWEGHYGDGWDTWTSYGGNPVANQDPSGLFILGFLGGASLQMEVGGAYSDEVLDAGVGAMGFVNNDIQSAGYAQLAMVEMIMDPDTPPAAMMGMNAAGMSFQTTGSAKLAAATGGLAASWATAVRTGYDRHHIIPRFLMGRYTFRNRLDLPSGLHRELHAYINRAFTDVGLPHPNTKNNRAAGQLSWRNRFRTNRVTPGDLQAAQRALIRGSELFDGRFPGYHVAQKVQLFMNMDSNVSKAGRLLRHGGRIR